MPDTKSATENEIIRVAMLGGFKLEAGGKSVQDTDARTHQLWHLIEYLIAFRRKEISQDELIGVLWPDSDIENPSNALKNLIYRIRTMLSSQGLPYAKEMILFSRGRYHWNNTLPASVDFEEFEELYNQAQSPTLDADTKIEKFLAAIALYRGDFLPNSRYENWAAQLGGHFNALYFKCVGAVLNMLGDRGRFPEVERICRDALKIDQFDEFIHRHLITALVRQGRQKQALNHYAYVTDLFFRELGVNLSGAMRSLYHEIIKTVNDVEADINAIKDELQEHGQRMGAFYCDYEVFKNLYQLEARTAARSGQSVFLGLLTLMDSQENEPDLKQRAKIMEFLHEMIKTSLRKGDVYSRFSSTQYVLMLPTLTLENCEMVVDRIIRRYKQAYRSKSHELVASVRPLIPVELME